MKTDNKEEAKRFLEETGMWRKVKDTNTTKLAMIEFASDFNNHMKSQDRFHPETFERVVKPDGYLGGMFCTNEESIEYEEALEEYEDALTLDQLIERCKEMRVLLKDVTDEMDYIDEEYDELPGLLNKVRRRISDLIKK